MVSQTAVKAWHQTLASPLEILSDIQWERPFSKAKDASPN